MRIYHISMNPLRFERRVFNQAETAVGSGAQVTILGCKDPDFDQKEYQRIQFYFVDSKFKKGPLRFIFFNLAVFAFLLRKRSGIIHCHDLWPLPAAAAASLLKNMPLVYDAHEYYAGLKLFEHQKLKKLFWMVLEWLSIPVADVLLTVSEPLGDLYKKRYPQLSKTLIIRNMPRHEIPHGDDSLKNRRKNDLKIVVFHGHFKPGRGLVPLIQAFKFIAAADLYLIGGGELENELKNLVAKLNLSEKIHFIDYIENDKLISFIAGADIGTVLFEPDSINYSHALPNKFFECLMAGLPVLASNIDTLENYVNEFNIGLTVRPDDPKEIAQKISEMLKDEGKRTQWRENSLRAAKELNWERESEKLKDIYEQIAR